MKKQTITACILLCIAGSLTAAVRIAQIDPSGLLLNQEMRAWISVSGNGIPVQGLSAKDFTLRERVPGRDRFRPVRITSFETGVNRKHGITMLLLVDNSGSMYRAWNGSVTPFAENTRIRIAASVIRSFLSSVRDPSDRVGLALFNTRFRYAVKPGTDRGRINETLQGVRMPVWKESYTELYAAVDQGARRLAALPGRKAIIVLTDGMNDPFSVGEKAPHPDYGHRIFTPADAIRACNRSGVSVFAVNMGTGRMHDKHIGRIASATGGASFEARNRRALPILYRRISDLMNGEYLITYRADMRPAFRKEVLVTVGKESGTREYYSGTIFGLPDDPTPLLLLPPAAALLLLWLLGRKHPRKSVGPGLDILDGAGTVLFEGRRPGKNIPLGPAGTMVFSLDSRRTVISRTPDEKPAENATILLNPMDNNFYIESTRPVRVNNNPVTRRRLSTGDLINMDGRTFVFDGGNRK